MKSRNVTADLEIPLDISAHELVLALNKAFALGLDTLDMRKDYLKAKNPTVLVKGGKSLRELGLRNGSELIYEL